MKLSDIVSGIHVDSAKFTEYALNENHPRGRHKAKVFEAALGYTAHHYTELQRQIIDKALDSEARLVRQDKHGEHYQIDIDINGMDARRATVRTGWVVPPKADTATLTTLYVIGKQAYD